MKLTLTGTNRQCWKRTETDWSFRKRSLLWGQHRSLSWHSEFNRVWCKWLRLWLAHDLSLLLQEVLELLEQVYKLIVRHRRQLNWIALGVIDSGNEIDQGSIEMLRPFPSAKHRLLVQLSVAWFAMTCVQLLLLHLHLLHRTWNCDLRGDCLLATARVGSWSLLLLLQSWLMLWLEQSHSHSKSMTLDHFLIDYLLHCWARFRLIPNFDDLNTRVWLNRLHLRCDLCWIGGVEKIRAQHVDIYRLVVSTGLSPQSWLVDSVL